MEKIDHRKTLKHLYRPSSRKPILLEVPRMNFLMMDGEGKPQNSIFQQTASTLYPLAYTLKVLVRSTQQVDFHVMPMEVLWKVNREAREFKWIMMLMQPEYVSAELFEIARQKVGESGRVQPSLLEKVRFEAFTEGCCVQLMHTGPYEGMDATLERMVSAAELQGCRLLSRSAHDIYLNDARKTNPANFLAVMRLPVAVSNGSGNQAK